MYKSAILAIVAIVGVALLLQVEARHQVYPIYPSSALSWQDPSIGYHTQPSGRWAEICHCNPIALGYGSDARDLVACENSCHTYTAPDCPTGCRKYQQDVYDPPSITNVKDLR